MQDSAKRERGPPHHLLVECDLVMQERAKSLEWCQIDVCVPS